MWRKRDSYLHEVPGFGRLSSRRAADAFVAWTESDAFRKAHGDARSPQGTLAGHPNFEGFEVVL